jgi:hypothetical protein
MKQLLYLPDEPKKGLKPLGQSSYPYEKGKRNYIVRNNKQYVLRD